MRIMLCGLLFYFAVVVHSKPYQVQDDRETRFTVHEKPPELVVNAGPEGVKVQAKPSKLQVIEYPHHQGTSWGGHGGVGGYGSGGHSWSTNTAGATVGNGCHEGTGAYVSRSNGCEYVGRGEGGWLASGHENWLHGGGGFGGSFHGTGFMGGAHHEHTTYVPSHTPPVHVGPNAPPIHVGPHVPAVHVGPHVPSIHYGTHAPLYHVGPHVPFVHMPPPVTTVHAGPMGPPVHVSSPPTVYHQPPVVYHQPHVVGHATDHNFGRGYGVGGYYGAAGGGSGYSGGHGGGYSREGGYGGHEDECCEDDRRGYGGGGYGGGYGRSRIPLPGKKHKRALKKKGESDDKTKKDVTEKRIYKRQMPYYGWHPFPASVHVGPHTPPIHIGPHYPPVHIGPHVPAVHIGPHVPYINIPAHVPAIHVRPHVPAVHISPPVPIINAGNHVPAVHVTSPPTVYHRPPIVIHQPHIVHSPNRNANNNLGHEVYGQEPPRESVVAHDAAFARGGGGLTVPHDGGFGGGFNGGREVYGKRDEIPVEEKRSFIAEPAQGKLSLKSLYSMVRPRRQLLGGSSDGGDSVIFVHPSGSSTPVGNSLTNDSPLGGLESGPNLGSGGSHGGLGGSSQIEAPTLPGSAGGAFAKSGLSGLASLSGTLGGSQESSFAGLGSHNSASLGSQENSFPGLGSHGLQGLGSLTGNIPRDFSNIGNNLGGLGGSMENSNGLSAAIPDSMSASMSLPNSQSQHEDSYAADTPNMNIGGIQGGFSEDSTAHNSEESSSSINNFQRSFFPSTNFAKDIDNKKHILEQSDLDNSTERDLKSTIPHEDEEEDKHERVHKDVIPRPEIAGYN